MIRWQATWRNKDSYWLRPEVFSNADAKRFYKELRLRDALVANGSWFGDEERVFRLGFGFLPPAELGEALTATTFSPQLSLTGSVGQGLVLWRRAGVLSGI